MAPGVYPRCMSRAVWREDDSLLPGSLSSVQNGIHTDVRLRGDRFPTSVDGSWGRSPLYVNRSLAGRRLTPARQSVISTKKHTYRCKTERGSLSDHRWWLLGSIPAVCQARLGRETTHSCPAVCHQYKPASTPM